jgi:hypothetical protein
MDSSSLGKAIVVLGLVLVLAGGFLWILGRAGLPVGRLPGDIRVEREGLSCSVPIVSMILLSLLLTILVNVILRVLNR